MGDHETMEGSQKTLPSASVYTAPLINTLACLWGAASAYILCCSLLVTHKILFALAALVPLIAAWATLERKRWGRMALMGLSLTTVGVFAFGLGVFMASLDHVQPQVRSVSNSLRDLAALYDISAAAIFGLVVLAAVTGMWMLRREVKAEFNENKKGALAGAQRVIAGVLVCCWGAAIAYTPLTLTDSRESASMGRSVKAGPRHVGRNAGRHTGRRAANR